MWKKGFLNDIFTVYLLDNSSYDDCLQSVFVPLYATARNVYDKFSVYMFLVDYCTCNFSVFVLYICLCLPVNLYFLCFCLMANKLVH